MTPEDSFEKPVLVYIADPMCSWCYGFQKEIEIVLERMGNEIEFRLLMGGLHQHTRQPMNEKFKEFLINHWREIALKTGQPFSFELLKNDNFIYNTIPACRAVVTSSIIDPGKSYSYFKEIQKAFFVDNYDTNNITTYLDIADKLNIKRSSFEYLYTSPVSNQKTLEQFSICLTLNARVFPTVLLQVHHKTKLIACGYTEAERMLYLLKDELKKTKVI